MRLRFALGFVVILAGSAPLSGQRPASLAPPPPASVEPAATPSLASRPAARFRLPAEAARQARDTADRPALDENTPWVTYVILGLAIIGGIVVLSAIF